MVIYGYFGFSVENAIQTWPKKASTRSAFLKKKSQKKQLSSF